MTLRERQSQFAWMVSHLIQEAFAMGFEVTLGDAYRDPRCPYGLPTSKHKRRLAIDLNLFLNGQYLEGTDSHRQLGEWWERRGGIWGGRFEDGNHYEWMD